MQRTMNAMKKLICMLLLGSMLVSLLAGCVSDSPEEPDRTRPAAETQAVQTEPEATVPADGDPADVTCKGSYTGEGADSAEIARIPGEAAEAPGETEETVPVETGSREETMPQEEPPEDAVLTNEALRVWYWAAVAAYRQAGQEPCPDWNVPLDAQKCGIDSSVGSWQQYFLRSALEGWHGVQALNLKSLAEGLPTEEAYQPDPEKHVEYMTGMPATKVLYGYNKDYAPNSMHQAYLDNLPDTLDAIAQERGYAGGAEMAEEAFGTSWEALKEAVYSFNYAYTYFTNLTYDAELTQEDKDACGGSESGEYYVNIRHLLVVPEDIVQEDTTPEWAKKDQEPTEPVVLEAVQIGEDGKVTASEEAWAIAQREAEMLHARWDTDRYDRTEGNFATLIRQNSDDFGSAVNGGAYRRVKQGQLLEVLDTWCFDEARQAGDTTILRSEYGYHVLYFSGKEYVSAVEAEEELLVQRQEAIVAEAKQARPMEVRYSDIVLTEAEGTVGWEQLLYPDVAHQRFPEAPLYLQQDYPTTKWGAYPIRTYGCGITTFAMLASYLADDELTPPEVCAMFGQYSFKTGTDGRLFNLEPDALGFYLKEKVYEHEVARQALAEGHVVVCVQHKGYWTRGGHYLLLEKMHEDGTIQVRDSNIYNYFRLKKHAEDRFEWSTIPGSAAGFWIYEKKMTSIPACSRCGDPKGVVTSLLTESYTCEQCAPEMLRRGTFLDAVGA